MINHPYQSLILLSSCTVAGDHFIDNDGTTGIVDMSQLIFSERAGIYSALKDVQFFNQVRIELGALTWPNGADIDPVWLHEEIGINKMWCVLA